MEYNAYNEDLFGIGIILYYLKNRKTFPTFVSKYNVNMQEGDILKGFEKDIKSFNFYFNSDEYKNHENELYNKIFLKFKDKNDNDTIDINEFIEELNTKKI